MSGGATFYLVTWCTVQPTEGGPLRLQQVDRQVSAAQELGYQVFLKILVGSCWATGGSRQESGTEGDEGTARRRPSAFPSDIEAYKRFVTTIVERYGARGVHEWGIENEVNAANFWQGTPAQYTQLAEAAAAAIRAADPAAKVLDAGLASVGYGAAIAAGFLRQGRAAEALAFYQRYFARRVEGGQSAFPRASNQDELTAALDSRLAKASTEYAPVLFDLVRRHVIDAYQLHFYESPQLLAEVLSYIRDGIGASAPIEAWEVGAAWPGRSYDEAQHGAETAKLLAVLLAGGVRRVIYLPAVYTVGGRIPQEVFRGLYAVGGHPRPAAVAYADMVRATAGEGVRYDAVSTKAVDGVVVANGRSTTVVAWSDGGARLPSAPPEGAQAHTFGGASVPWGGGGLRLGSDPLVLTLHQDAAAARSLIATAG
jgi:hypothetical protein